MESAATRPFREAFKGKLALVTGAGSGIGAAIATDLSDQGADLLLTDIDGPAIEGLAEKLRPCGAAVSCLAGDCASLIHLDHLAERAEELRGRVDITVVNAGTFSFETFPDVTPEGFDKVLQLNLRGAFFLIQRISRMIPSGGRIITIASVSGVHGKSLSPAYAASKAGLIAITRNLAPTLAARGITINAVAPGLIDTPLNAALDHQMGVVKAGLPPGAFIGKLSAGIPAGRLGTVTEVAAAVSFLASEKAGYITGETMIISGGWVID